MAQDTVHALDLVIFGGNGVDHGAQFLVGNGGRQDGM